MGDPDHTSATVLEDETTVTDEAIETRWLDGGRTAAHSDDTGDVADTGDDAGDTGDDAGDTGDDSGDDAGDTGDDPGEDSGDSGDTSEA